MRFIRTITTLLLAAMFLVSFTGVRLLVHHCAGCDTSEIIFASEPVSCCSGSIAHTDHSDNAEETPFCCSAPETAHCGIFGDSGCCDFEVIYLKGEFQITQHKAAEKVTVPVFDMLAVFSTTMPGPGIAPSFAAEGPFIDPPPRLAGKAFVLYAHQIKIA